MLFFKRKEGEMAQKLAQDVFENWISYQEIFDYVDLEVVGRDLTTENLSFFKSKYSALLDSLKIFFTFFNLFSCEKLEQLQVLDDKFLKKKFSVLHELVQNDMQGFIDFLRKHNFVKICADQKIGKAGENRLSREYKNLLKALFFKKNVKERETLLFAVSNKFFHYCFAQKTWPQFKKMLSNKKDYPVIDFLFSNLWWNLAGSGWKNWSAEVLKSLKKDANKGKEVVYIAGGCDVYQLIKAGVYNVTVIDPFLPSQLDYYFDTWHWLVDEGDEDEIIFQQDNLIMKKEVFEQDSNSFTIKLSTGRKKTFKQSVTVWNVYCAKTDKKLGKYKFERRLANQDDFKNAKNKSLLISFNELYFITIPQEAGGWGIDPYKLDINLNLHVKQLHYNISTQVLRNMRDAFDLDYDYLALGSCVD